MKMLIALCAALPTTLAFAAVNVNNAQQSELQRTPGLDKVKAKAIIEWRAANGSIDNFTELQQVPGFTPELVEQLKAQIAFSGDAYVPPKKAEKPEKKKPAATASTPAPRALASR